MAKEVCAHVEMLRTEMQRLGVTIWSEHGEQPAGWVNVHCRDCQLTFEVTMRPRDGVYPVSGCDDKG